MYAFIFKKGQISPLYFLRQLIVISFLCASFTEMTAQIVANDDYLCGGNRIGNDFYRIEILLNDELAGSTPADLEVTFLNNPTPYASVERFGTLTVFILLRKTEDVPLSVSIDSLQYILKNTALNLEPDTASIYISYDSGCVEDWGRICNLNASFTGLDTEYCANEVFDFEVLTPNQTGGLWYLNNSTTPIDTIDLSTLPIGSNSLKYKLSFGDCADSTIQQFNVSIPPNTDWDYIPKEFCSIDPDLDLTSLKDTTGGEWTINGLINSTFSPNSLAPGDYQITYQITDGVCTDSASQQFQVIQQPNANWDFPNKELCSVDTIINLFELDNNPNGQWTINSITDSIIDPRIDPEGDYNVLYKITNGICADSASQVFKIRKQPDAQWNYFKTNFCSTDEPLELGVIRRVDGTVWSVDGQDTTHFVPRELTIGDHVIELKQFNDFCLDSFSNIFSIQQQANPAWMNDTYEFCDDDDTLNLRTLANLPGTTWRVNGVETDDFIPANYSNGNHLILHRVEQGVCITSVSRIFEVQNRPSADWNVSKTTYCSDEPDIVLTTQSTNPGGQWFINNTPSTLFSPTSLSAGRYQVRYEIANEYCMDSLSTELTVDLKPNAQWAGIDPTYCNNQPPIELINGLPAGGEWYVNDLPNRNFEPQQLENTQHQIDYIYFNGVCSDTASQSVEVIERADAGFEIADEVCSDAPDLPLNSLNPNGIWFLDSLNNPITNWSPSTINAGTYRLINVVDNGVCSDTVSKNMSVIEIIDAGWKPLPDSICIYSNAIDLDTLLFNRPQNSIWKIGSDTVPAIYRPFDDQQDSLKITHINSNGQCTSQYEQTIFKNRGPLIGQVDLSICGNQVQSLAFIDSQRTTWFDQNNLINIEFSDDSVLFEVNNITLSDTLIAVELDGTSCLQRALYSVAFSREQLTAPFAGEDIALSFEETRFSLQANEPEFDSGKWLYDDEVVQVFNPEESNSSGKLLKNESVNLIWTFESENCPTLSDTLLINKTIFKVSGGISPNGDGINDYFEVIGINKDNEIAVSVINRWGQVVFESDNYLNDWGGTNRNNDLLPIDTYFYTVSISGLQQKKVVKGELVIKP